MNPPVFPLLLAYEIFYIEAGQIYQLRGDKIRIPLTEKDFDTKVQKYRETKTEYMLLYDYMFILKKDKWEAMPSEINIEEIEFYYQLSVLNEEEYMKLKYLHSEYAKNSEH